MKNQLGSERFCFVLAVLRIHFQSTTLKAATRNPDLVYLVPLFVVCCA